MVKPEARRQAAILSILATSAAVVLAAVALAAYADGAFDRAFDARFWRLLLLEPVLAVYWVAALPAVGLMRERAVAALRAIVLLPGQEVQRLAAAHGAAGRRYFWLCVTVGVLAGQALLQPWTRSTDMPRLYVLHWLMTVVVWGLIGGFIGETFNGARLLGRLQQERLTLDLFDTSPLQPLARWALSVVLGFAGAATIAAVAILDEDVLRTYGLRSLTIYGLMSATATGLFFLGVWDSHRLIGRMKQLELSDVTRRLAAAHAALRSAMAADEPNTTTLAAAVATWALLEQRLRAISEWPFNTATLRNLAAALLAPAAAAAFRAYVELR